MHSHFPKYIIFWTCFHVSLKASSSGGMARKEGVGCFVKERKYSRTKVSGGNHHHPFSKNLCTQQPSQVSNAFLTSFGSQILFLIKWCSNTTTAAYYSENNYICLFLVITETGYAITKSTEFPGKMMKRKGGVICSLALINKEKREKVKLGSSGKKGMAGA